MSQTGPWSVKGIDARAREAARDRAREEGMTLGEYLNSLILKGGEVAPQDIAAPISAPKPRPQAGASSLNKLVSRIEAAEARSTLAITGIDQSVVGLLKRIEDAETEHIAMARHVDGVIDDIRSTYDALRDKVRKIEEDDSAEQNLEALKALENALGKLASHVYEENALAQSESDAIKGRVEAGFSDVNAKLEQMDGKVETTLTDAARRVEKAVEQAELRAEGTARHLSERMSAIDAKITRQERSEEQLNERVRGNEERLKQHEQTDREIEGRVETVSDRIDEAEARLARQERGSADISTRIDDAESRLKRSEKSDQELSDRIKDTNARIDAQEESENELSGRVQETETRIGIAETTLEDTSARIDAIEGDVTTALESMEGTLLRVQDRLNRAESTTDAALKSLESTFDVLDKRIGEVADAAPEYAVELRKQFEERFNGLAEDLRASIDATRTELAAEIENAAKAGITPDQLETFETKLNEVQRNLAENDERHAEAIETVGEQVSRISENFDQRLQDVEAATGSEEAAAQFSRLTEAVQDRLDQLELRESTAIERVGDEMTKLADQLDQRISDSEQRSASAIEQVGEQVSRVATRLQTRQDEALQAFSEKLDETQTRSEARLSDALANVSERLELMQEQSSNTLSPVQKAIASLATRLDSLEEFASPPFADAPRAAALPEMSPLPVNDPLFANEKKAEDETEFATGKIEDIVNDLLGEEEPNPTAHSVEADADTGEPSQQEAVEADAVDAADDVFAEDDTFEPGIESWDDVQDSEDEKSEDPEFIAEVPQADAADIDDVVSELENWEDSASEARDIDVFDEEFEGGDEASEEEQKEPGDLDYIASARAAALSAAADGADGKQKRKDKAPRAGRVAGAKSDNSGGSSKLPLIATASVVAVAAAAGTAYYAMKDNEQVDLQKISTPQSPVDTSSLELAGTEPDAVDAFETADAAETTFADPDDLFEETASTETAAIETAASEPAADTSAEPEVEAPVEVAAETASAPAPAVSEASPVEVAPAASAPTEASAPAPKTSFAKIAIPTSLESAAAGGDTKALYTLGQSQIDTGKYAKGAELMRQAAERGEPAAQYRLGKLHEKGLGVPRDLTQARRWTEEAANSGNIRAMHDLAVFYAQGDGGPQSYAVAVNWFRKAAEYGVIDSQYNLGVLYEQGIGINPDPAEAMFWFVAASRGGDAVSSAKIQELSQTLPIATVDAVTARAESWSPKKANGIANGFFADQDWGSITRQHITQVQTALNALGYDVGYPDGSVGPATATAIRRFEADYGLASSGRVSADLIRKINEFASS